MWCHTSEFTRDLLQSGIHKVPRVHHFGYPPVSFWIPPLYEQILLPHAFSENQANSADPITWGYRFEESHPRVVSILRSLLRVILFRTNKIRKTKFETIPQIKNQNVSNEAGLNFENWDLSVCSDFELRISDFNSGVSLRRSILSIAEELRTSFGAIDLVWL